MVCRGRLAGEGRGWEKVDVRGDKGWMGVCASPKERRDDLKNVGPRKKTNEGK